jgi:hypothetical protein
MNPSSLPPSATSLTSLTSDSMTPALHNPFPPLRPRSLRQTSRPTASVSGLRPTCTPLRTHLIRTRSDLNEHTKPIYTPSTPNDPYQYTRTAIHLSSYRHSHRLATSVVAHSAKMISIVSPSLCRSPPSSDSKPELVPLHRRGREGQAYMLRGSRFGPARQAAEEPSVLSWEFVRRRSAYRYIA